MLKDKLNNKNICVIGFNTLLGRIFLKRLIDYFSFDSLLYLVELKSDSTKVQKFKEDSYFGPTGKQWIQSHVKFIALNQLNKELPQIDILLNFFIPLDFSQFDKAIEYHILRTRLICQQLKKLQIKRTVMASSIYCQNPGYVPEAEQPEEYLLELPRSLNREELGKQSQTLSKQTLDNFIKESFTSLRECWQWSIKVMEKEYGAVSESIEIVRVPSLGPTLHNFEGYADKFNYFTYFVYLMGTGFFERVNGHPGNVTDLVPADFLFNYMVVLATRTQSPGFRIHNLSTSSRNPVTIEKLLTYFTESWHQYQKKPLKLKISSQKWEKKVQSAKEELPIRVKARLSHLLDLKKWKIQSQQQVIDLQKKKTLAKKYEFFLQHEWICESNYSIDLANELDQTQSQLFCFNVNSINWRVYAKLCCFSIKKYLLNQHVEGFQSSSADLLQMQQSRSYFSDVIWALTEGKVVTGVNHIQLKKYILSTKAVKEAIKSLVEERMLKLENEPISYQKAEEELYKAADDICLQMFSQYNMNSIRLFAWFLHKVFKTIYEKVVVDTQALLKLRNHNEKELGPLIVIPTHRSYVDFLIMGYVFFGYQVKLPHIAAAEDFLNMALVHILLRKSGAFFIKRNQQKHRILYKAILDEYISKILGDSHYLEFFIEGTRCRVGKMLLPKFGVLSIVAKNVLDGRIPDAQILPITLNYEKVLEGQSFTYEMMGESKVKESLTRLIKAVDTLKQNYGRIYIEFCEPFSVKKYFQTSNQPFNRTLQKLGYEIVYKLSDNLIITAPAVLATVVLMHRKGISDDALSEQVQWLCKELKSRGIKVARSQSDSSISISNTLSLMSDTISKSKKNMFEVQVSFEQDSFVKLFTMTYYRNTLTHIFWEESLVLLALTSFGHEKIIGKNVKEDDKAIGTKEQPIGTNVTLDQLWTQTKFLFGLLIKEYVLRHSLTDRHRFMEVVSLMQQKKVLRLQGEFVMLGEEGHPSGNYFPFYGSLVWPIVQSYWLTSLYLFKLKTLKPIPLEQLLQEIQWFGQSLISERIITHLQSISMDTIKNAVETFILLKVVKKFNHQYKDGTKVTSIALNVSEEQLKRLQQRIEIFLKKSYAKSVKGILESGQGSVNLDFPFLSKL